MIIFLIVNIRNDDRETARLETIIRDILIKFKKN